MRKTILLLAFLMSFSMQGIAAGAGEDFGEIDQSLDRAFQHARSYPPEFSSKLQRLGLEKELIRTIGELEHMIDSSTERQEVLFRLGKANTFAYNLDMPGSDEKADQYFAELFRLVPDHAEGHLFYGQHLSGRGDFQSGIEHLQIAANAGFDVALNMMALAYYQMGDKEKARMLFQELLEKYPQDPQTQMMLDILDGT